MSEYSDLIKNYEKIREYMRDFYIYGFRARDDYAFKSGRSYDNERRRIESYLGDILCFRRDGDGKKVFLTADASTLLKNPFYKTFKAKSFTKNDVNLHFSILYLLKKHGELDLTDFFRAMQAEIFEFFKEDSEIDVATVRNKLKEYCSLGLLLARKEKGKLLFRLADKIEFPQEGNFTEGIEFFSENFPVGVIGSFLLDRLDANNRFLTSKHKYPADAVDSEIACTLLSAVREKKKAKLCVYSYRRNRENTYDVLPLKLAFTTQSGRNYLLSYSFKTKDFISLRLDYIKSAEPSKETFPDFEDYKIRLEEKLKKLWGVSMSTSVKEKTLKVCFAIGENEEYILHRLMKEKRNGELEKTGENEWTLKVITYDLSELTPWLRTFVGRIKSLEASDKKYAARFMSDVAEMKKLYGLDDISVNSEKSEGGEKS